MCKILCSYFYWLNHCNGCFFSIFKKVLYSLFLCDSLKMSTTSERIMINEKMPKVYIGRIPLFSTEYMRNATVARPIPIFIFLLRYLFFVNLALITLGFKSFLDFVLVKFSRNFLLRTKGLSWVWLAVSFCPSTYSFTFSMESNIDSSMQFSFSIIAYSFVPSTCNTSTLLS